MTQDMMTLRALLEKSSDADLLREMIGFTAERLMALEVEGLPAGSRVERNALTPRAGTRSFGCGSKHDPTGYKVMAPFGRHLIGVGSPLVQRLASLPAAQP